ncbi:Transaldolase [subsurface metagenome]
MKKVNELQVKIFSDGAEKADILKLYKNPLIKGFTTNPTLMRKAGITDYRSFAIDLLQAITDRPISFEVFDDTFPEMKRQALEIAGWGENVYVKIPITNTRREPAYDLILDLTSRQVKLNITAILATDQVRELVLCLQASPSAFVSVFAGRIADTGVDPVPLMAECVKLLRPYPNLELLWASSRELLNIFQADAIGCGIITVTPAILKKMNLVGKDLHEYSLDTVKMFYEDGRSSGFSL